MPAFVALRVGPAAVNVVQTAYTAVQAITNALTAATPVGFVVIAIAALAAGFVLAYNTLKPFHDAVNPAFVLLKARVTVAGVNVDYDVTMAGVIADFDVTAGGGYAVADLSHLLGGGVGPTDEDCLVFPNKHAKICNDVTGELLFTMDTTALVPAVHQTDGTINQRVPHALSARAIRLVVHDHGAYQQHRRPGLPGDAERHHRRPGPYRPCRHGLAQHGAL
jgi:hypothetical protein